jgi:hypothetical protein
VGTVSEHCIVVLKTISAEKLNVLAEPVGTAAPKVPPLTKIYTTEQVVGVKFSLACPAQGFPPPTFR